MTTPEFARWDRETRAAADARPGWNLADNFGHHIIPMKTTKLWTMVILPSTLDAPHRWDVIMRNVHGDLIYAWEALSTAAAAFDKADTELAAAAANYTTPWGR